jgi:hypothetical protein
MVQGTLQSGTLDAFAPRTGGVLDLGDVTIANGRAHATASTSWVNGALGIDDALAAKLGAADDLATRYANPDVDNDGVIDALQADHNFRLDLQGKLDITVGGELATIDTLVRGQMMTGTVGVSYLETGILVGLPKAYAHDMADATFTFAGDFYGTSLSNATPAIAAGAAVAQPELKLGSIDGQPTLGAFARAGYDVPAGEYTVAIGAHVLTFADVRPSADAQLATAQNLAVPFIQLAPTEADCVTDCQIASIRTTWKRNTAGGWTDIADGEMSHGAHLDIVRWHAGAMQTFTIELPAKPSTDVAWSAMPMVAGMTPADLAGITTSELCYVAMTYDDEVGMRVTSQIANPACGY